MQAPPQCDTTDMAKDIITVRVLQQDTQDEIKIGAGFPIWNDQLDQVEENTRKQYDQRLEWCGGFQAGCEKYYKRIALVDADTLQSIREIYPGKEA